MDQNLDIALRSEDMVLGDQAAPKLSVIEYLAIADHHHVPVLAEHRLASGFEVHDAQATEAKPDTVGMKAALGIRAPVNELGGHGPDRVLAHRLALPE